MRIKPSLKEKKRYIVYEILSSEQFGFEIVKNEIHRTLQRFLGEFGVAKANPKQFENVYTNNKGIIRVSNKSVNDVKAALTMITKINDKKVVLRTLGTSGMIKKAQQKFMKTNDNEV